MANVTRDIDQCVRMASGFLTITDYKAYLAQLEADHRASGAEATADDYAVMLCLVRLLEPTYPESLHETRNRRPTRLY